MRLPLGDGLAERRDVTFDRLQICLRGNDRWPVVPQWDTATGSFACPGCEVSPDLGDESLYAGVSKRIGMANGGLERSERLGVLCHGPDGLRPSDRPDDGVEPPFRGGGGRVETRDLGAYIWEGAYGRIRALVRRMEAKRTDGAVVPVDVAGQDSKGGTCCPCRGHEPGAAAKRPETFRSFQKEPLSGIPPIQDQPVDKPGLGTFCMVERFLEPGADPGLPPGGGGRFVLESGKDPASDLSGVSFEPRTVDHPVVRL